MRLEYSRMMTSGSMYITLLLHGQHMDIRAGYTVAAQSTRDRHMAFRAGGTVDTLL